MSKEHENQEISKMFEFVKELNEKLVEAMDIAEETATNAEGLLKDLVVFCRNETSEVDKIVSDVSLSAESLIEYVKKTNDEVLELTEDKHAADAKIIALEINVHHLQSDNDELKKSAEKSKQSLQVKNTEIRNMANSQASLGSVLSTLLWKISQSEEITHRIITSEDGDTLRDFLFLAHMALTSFMQEYKEKLPPTTSSEFRMGLGIVGLLVNISGHSKGRTFMVEEPAGRQVVQVIMESVEQIDIVSGYLIKRLAMVFLFNMSISKRGSQLLGEQEKGITSVFKCVKETSAADIQCFSVKIILSLLDDADSNAAKMKIVKLISADELQMRINDCNDEDFTELTKNLMRKLDTLKNS